MSRDHSSRLVIKRVFNNSAVLAVDSSGAEQVLLGRGIGFHLHSQDEVDQSLAQGDDGND